MTKLWCGVEPATGVTDLVARRLARCSRSAEGEDCFRRCGGCVEGKVDLGCLCQWPLTKIPAMQARSASSGRTVVIVACATATSA